ncbi:uncharacterized protein LOC119267235 [Triticum dicoccoides]|uniref:uncharacterized protein LOC119267235 n=1 Tax=Triticum dicoccoides TaxID=85692 RepID=UPI00188FFE7D|nr:uncharacterized protein LOC119267235 [Triticum dicoccoides]
METTAGFNTAISCCIAADARVIERRCLLCFRPPRWSPDLNLGAFLTRSRVRNEQHLPQPWPPVPGDGAAQPLSPTSSSRLCFVLAARSCSGIGTRRLTPEPHGHRSPESARPHLDCASTARIHAAGKPLPPCSPRTAPKTGRRPAAMFCCTEPLRPLASSEHERCHAALTLSIEPSRPGSGQPLHRMAHEAQIPLMSRL